MAARRERERRRPGGGERRYRFATPETALEPDDTLVEQDREATELAEEAPAAARTRARREPAAPTATATRGARATAARPFSAYKDEYAYVYGDLRRVGAVIGSLLLILIVLYFVLPIIVR
jgi:hypothetical protein